MQSQVLIEIFPHEWIRKFNAVFEMFFNFEQKLKF